MDREGETISYVIPERRITGSVPELLEEIDDMIEALQTVREAVVQRASKPARPAQSPGWRARFARALSLKP